MTNCHHLGNLRCGKKKESVAQARAALENPWLPRALHSIFALIHTSSWRDHKAILDCCAEDVGCMENFRSPSWSGFWSLHCQALPRIKQNADGTHLLWTEQWTHTKQVGCVQAISLPYYLNPMTASEWFRGGELLPWTYAWLKDAFYKWKKGLHNSFWIFV